MKDGVNLDPETLQAELVQAVRDGRAHRKFQTRLGGCKAAETRSGKILRQVIRK